jgi:phytoene dehydrogenase-like protein
MPEDYDHFCYPGLEFAARKGAARYQQDLEAMFPAERANIERYFRDVKRAASWAVQSVMTNALPQPIASGLGMWNRLTSRKPLMTTGAYLETRFHDTKLRALLASQWGDFGLPPSRSAFAVHALIADHYFDGAWYPEGGAGVIAEGAGEVIRANGGEILVNHEVKRILVENGRAAGVEVARRVGKQGETVELRAPVVVSNAGAWTTFRKLLPEGEWTPPAAELDGALASASVATLYVGLNRDPRELGFRGENYWLFDGFDHDQSSARSNDLLDGKVHTCYLSFPSLKNPRAVRHTAEIIAPIGWDALAKYQEEPWRRRGEEYNQAKERISAALIEFVEQRHPGFQAAVEYRELSTPLTVEHFTGHPHGAIYGYPATPERFGLRWLGPKTGIRGLFLAGADSGSLGIVGALMGGVMAAAQNLGPLGFFRVMAAAAIGRSEPTGQNGLGPALDSRI